MTLREVNEPWSESQDSQQTAGFWAPAETKPSNSADGAREGHLIGLGALRQGDMLGALKTSPARLIPAITASAAAGSRRRILRHWARTLLSTPSNCGESPQWRLSRVGSGYVIATSIAIWLFVRWRRSIEAV